MDTEFTDDRNAFCKALECASWQERAAYIDRVCGEDSVRRARLEQLLRAHSNAGDFLCGATHDASLEQGLRPQTIITEGPGALIDRYKLLQHIGEGGFGIVYMAEQKEPVKRRVALKIIKLGMDTKQVIGRFEAERQALAMMEHPNIARVLDGGATATGRPYFVMELVRGIPITQFCDEHRLSPEKRLELFMDVCAAVQHAHQKGVIHRDIKPSNVLVTLHDHRGVPKVIDFGVAKATQQELTEKTIFTRFNEFIGTPEYMSPEQAQMSGLDIDTRSDIYSLGVLLYELLTGQTPLNGRELVSGGYDLMRRRICEEEPLKPSTRFSTLSEEDKTTVASRRKTDPDQLRSLIRGELDWVVMKAMEKDRGRRYPSAAAMAEDVQRYLDNEPVTAAAPSVLYRLKKFGQRHRTPVTMGILAVVLLLISVGVSNYYAIRARRAERQAVHEAAVADAVNRFLNEDLFAQAAAGGVPDPDLRVRTLLDRATSRIENRFDAEPLVESAIHTTLGRKRIIGDLMA